MDAKRRKLNSGEAMATEIQQFDSSEVLMDAIKSSNMERIMNELVKLKEHLATKERVLNFLEKNRQTFRAIISFVVNHGSAKFVHKSQKKSSNEQQINLALREAFSLLANACHLSVLACSEIRSKDLGLSNLYVRLLETSDKTIVPIPLKAVLLRLLGNLCELKETAQLISMNKPLIGRIALCLELDDPSVFDPALRIIRFLAKRARSTTSVIRSEACLYLAKYIARHNENEEIFKNNTEILQIFTFLIKYHSSSVGRQIANCSEFVEQCMSLLLKYPSFSSIDAPKLYEYWIHIIIRCIESSFEFRTVLGHSAINKVLELEENREEINNLHCRFLCAFTQDIHGFTWLHENSGISRILDKLKIIDQNAAQNEIVNQLRIQNFIFESLCVKKYSEGALGYIVQYPTFMPSALFHIQKYLEQNSTNCKIEYIQPGEVEESFASIFDNNNNQEETNNNSNDEQPQQQPLCKDFSLMRKTFFPSPSASPESIRAACWSPSMSPSTSGIFSNSSNPGASPTAGSGSDCSPPHSATQSFILDELLWSSDAIRQSTASPILYSKAPNEVEPDDPNEIEDKNESDEVELNKEEIKLRKQIVRNILQLISNFSHQEERKSIFLLKSEILDTLIRYISEAPEMESQLARALRRLARHQSGLELLLNMDFHWMVINRLIRRPCILARHSKPCPRCDVRYDFGRSLLADHELLADSPMGEYVLLKLRMDATGQLEDLHLAKFSRLKILMAGLILFNQRIRRHNFYYNFRPIDALLEEFGRNLNSSENAEISEDSNDGEMFCNIVATFGQILSKNHLLDEHQPISLIRFLCENEPQPSNSNEEKCVLEDECSSSGEEKLKFKNEKGELLVEVPKKKLCNWNEYFSGMFNSEFIERIQCRNEFQFNSEMEGCSEEDFITFLHFSIGCPLKSECVQINNAECCSALLCLADKYLCTRLLDHLLANGMAARFINGQTLRLFLPLAISVPTIGDGGGLKNLCMLILFRNSNNSELISTLRHMKKCDAGNGQINEALRIAIHEFIFANSG